MSFRTFLPIAFFSCIFLLFTNLVFAQQNPVVQFSGAQMRAPLSLPKGTSTVQICGLEPGATYQVIAVPMAFKQKATFEIAPATVLTKGTSQFVFSRDDQHSVRFAAPAACIDLQIKAGSVEQGSEIPLFLSIRCETCPAAPRWLDKTIGLSEQAVLGVQGGQSAQSLIENVLVGGGCFQISNVAFSGQNSQIGTFSNGLTNIGFDNGVILATGNILMAPGPNNSDGLSFGFGIPTPDADLQSLANGSIFDRAVIEFDFVPTQNQVSFEFAFASEEYCEYVNSQFNDVFGFFISGPGINGTQNIALVPNTNIPVTINTVNHTVNEGLYTHNTPGTPGRNNCQSSLNVPPVPPATGPAVQELQYDGFTKKMVAVANVIPCETYRIKLKIADVGDGVWDSAVFLRANSFSAGGQVLASPAYPGGFGTAYENCDAGSVRFARGNNDVSQPLVVDFTVAGSATPGVDYVPISSPVTIPAGQMELLVPIQVIPDQLMEGPENILFVLPNACSCTQATIEFVINDRPDFSLESNHQALCEGEIAALTPTVSGGLPSYNYLWNTGETTLSISPGTTGTYTLSVTDGCGATASISNELVFSNCSCAANTFLKTLGEPGENVQGFGVYDSQDGNLYLTGMKQDSAMIVKMTPTGTVLWTRTLDVVAGVNDRITELIVDTEGRIVGCGYNGDLTGQSGFVFRYNPLTNLLQWASTFSLETPTTCGIMELPNGNYLLYDNPDQPIENLRTLEITRPDGTIDPSSPLSQKLSTGTSESLNSALIHNGKLYGVGRSDITALSLNFRHMLTCIDLATGTVDWTRTSHVGPNTPARVRGIDLLIEDEHLISLGFGSETDLSLLNSQIFLQKNDLAGNLVWVKRFNIPEAFSESMDEVISVPDGFILYGRDRDVPSDLFLLKTDKDGNLLWSKKVDYGFVDFVGAVSNYQSQILLKNDHLFLVASTEKDAGSDYQMLVIKTTLDGTLEGNNCDFIQPILADSSTVNAPVNLAINLAPLPFNEEPSFLTPALNPTNLVMETLCRILVEDQVDITRCLGDTVLIAGISYAQDTTFQLEIPGNNSCDTLRTYTLAFLPQITRSEDISFCTGGSVTIGGQVYDQPGTVIDTIPGQGSDCDTVVTYTLTLHPLQTRSEDISFCSGGSVTIGGQVYDQAGTVLDTIPGQGGDCDTVVTYTLTLLPIQNRSEDISFCTGSSVTIGGQVYDQSGTVIDTIPGQGNDCDTVVTYTLTLLPIQTRSEDISFCPGGSVTIGGQVYDQSGTVIDTLPGQGNDCDTVVTYTLTLLPIQTRSEDISFCPGGSVTIGGQVYDQSGTVIDTLPGLGNACDTVVTYTLTLLTQPTRNESISFCPGESISLGGTNYTQPSTVILTLPSSTGGCDTMVTYTLQFSTPAPSNLSITCPSAISISVPGGSGAVVDYADATAASDCLCPGLDVSLSSGLPSGSNFPSGTSTVCYTAQDSCGQTSSCCFNVTIEDEDACDTKVNGCIKYELLTITEDAGKNRTYRIRVTNNCANKLIYTAIQIPKGLVAIEPANFSTYTAPSGNTYVVRSPNFSPQYSIRFSSVSDSIHNGESDIFKYTIPAQANEVLFIHVISRLAPNLSLNAHLNTFYCPIGVTQTENRPINQRDALEEPLAAGTLLLFPNPTNGELFADLSPWQGERLQVQVLDSRGQRVQQSSITASGDAQYFELPDALPAGLYFLEVLTEQGERHTARFVLQR
jgi:hypothetical protein